jgi:hypothetical protein
MAEPCQPVLHASITKNTGAECMRRHRERRREGLRSYSIDLRQTEVDELIRRGFLEPEKRHDYYSVVEAFHAFLDQVFL